MRRSVPYSEREVWNREERWYTTYTCGNTSSYVDCGWCSRYRSVYYLLERPDVPLYHQTQTYPYKHMLSHAELDGITSSDSIEWYSFPTVQDQWKKTIGTGLQWFRKPCDLDQFFSMYQTATSEPHGFLYIDTNAKSEESRSRNGFNHYFMNKSTEEK